jgi:hypothetical protein
MDYPPARKGKAKAKKFNFKNGVALVSFLNRIPNMEKIKFKLSDEERNVVGDN